VPTPKPRNRWAHGTKPLPAPAVQGKTSDPGFGDKLLLRQPAGPIFHLTSIASRMPLKLARKAALVSLGSLPGQRHYGRMNVPFVYTEVEIAAVLRVAPEAVRAWLRRGDLRPIALTSDGRSLFALGDVEAIGRR